MQEENVNTPGDVREESLFTTPETPRTAAPGRNPFFVFNINTLLALILLAGLAALYVLHFRSGSGSAEPLPAVQKAPGDRLSVVFVNTDSLNAHYEFVKTLRNELEGTGRKLQNEVMAEQSRLEKEADDFQKKIAANQISEEQAKAEYEQLMQKQQELMQKKEHYTQLVAEQEMNMNLRLVDSVTAFLQRFNRQYHFDYIMGYKAGGEILVANDTLDITPAVLKALNEEFQARKQ